MTDLTTIDVNVVIFASIGAGAEIAVFRAARPGARPVWVDYTLVATAEAAPEL